MNRKQRVIHGLCLLTGLVCVRTLPAQLPSTGDFDVAYSVSGSGPTRAAAPSSSSLAGPLSFGVYLRPQLLVAGSTQLFSSTKDPGSTWKTRYGVTKLEINGDLKHWEKHSGSDTLNRDFMLDYTLIIPTNDPDVTVGETFGHQFLAQFNFDQSAKNNFEIDMGDQMSGRDGKTGFKHTGLLSLIGQHNVSESPGYFIWEVDASPSSEGAPASVTASPGIMYKIKPYLRLTAVAVVGITANDPAIGFSIGLKYTGNFTSKPSPEKARALTFSRLRRLERFTQFGRLGRF
jgi:hypothetical protein